MQQKELNELTDQSLLNLYKSLIPSTTMLEHFGAKLDNHGGGTLHQIKDKATSTNEIGYETDKSLLNYKRHLIEMKIFSLKVLEEINRRELETSEYYELINKEIEYIESCTDFFDTTNAPSLASVPPGTETLPYLNRSLKK
ncbi:MAG: hypothetical protein P8M50_00640 [Paracoccaceae bacterium]|nr:hypothetical protein [Paracoccaceae bacterium]